jgi:hypothetical protein
MLFVSGLRSLTQRSLELRRIAPILFVHFNIIRACMCSGCSSWCYHYFLLCKYCVFILLKLDEMALLEEGRRGHVDHNTKNGAVLCFVVYMHNEL